MKVVFSGAGIVEMSGKSQGTIIQKSYGGYQLRKLVIPNKRRSNASQIIRQNFSLVNSSWRTLTIEQQGTWIAAAPSGVSGFEFYSSYNLGLVNGGGTLIAEFVAPVSNPLADVIFRLFNSFTEDPPNDSFLLQKLSYRQLIPSGDWQPSFKWTGWIPASRYSYPRTNLLIPRSAIYVSPEIMSIAWSTTPGLATAPGRMGVKAKLQEAYVNQVTGQVYVSANYDLIATGDIEPPQIYQPETALSTGVFTTIGSDNYFTQTFESGNSSYDFTVWKPYFWFTGWLPNSSDVDVPMLVQIPDTAITFIDSSSFTVEFGPTPGMAEMPTNLADDSAIGIIWERVSDSYKEGEAVNSMQASNH